MDEDVQRRDFTLNSLYYDPLKEQVIDYTGGLEDIKKGIVKPVIPLNVIFEEDPVRMLRAVKYAATTGCRMPYSLKKKIRSSAHLLSPVSPSRLTEEMMKIINSGHSYDIVSLALDMDIYPYLQPAATELIFSNKQFGKKYLNSLKDLDSFINTNPEAALGAKLEFIVRDFVESLTDWNKEIATNSAAGELYTRTWTQCRNFVLPMNPQRSELEYAIRMTLKKLGVQVKIPKKNRIFYKVPETND